MFMKPRGPERDGRSLKAFGSAMGEGVTGTDPDEANVFDVEIEAADLEDALQRISIAIGVSGTNDHILFLEDPDLPEEWLAHAGKPRAKPAAAD
jgi:hypothetical protein